VEKQFDLGCQRQYSAVICHRTLLFSSRVLRTSLVTLCSHKSGHHVDDSGNIKFTYEMEQDNKLLFLDVLFNRQKMVA